MEPLAQVRRARRGVPGNVRIGTVAVRRLSAVAGSPQLVLGTRVRYVFTRVESSAFEFWFRMALTLAIAILSSRAGLSLGGWIRRVRR